MKEKIVWGNLTTNERDALIAEHIFGRTIVKWKEDRALLMERVGMAGHEAIPAYSTNMDAAWALFKHFADLPDDPFESHWKKYQFMHELGMLPCSDQSWYDISYEILVSWTPEKISISALKAVDVEVE
jgi:hypothetical protein